MISIIVCSINKELLEQLKKNVAEKIGVPFEIVAVANSVHNRSISSVYNTAAKKSNFEFLCFLHEDILIHTKDWGKKIVEHLSDSEIGLVGVSGAVYKSKYPGTWSTCDRSLYRTHSIQHFKNRSEPVVTRVNPLNETTSEVVVIDGVFMAVRKEVFEQFSFDDVTLTGFHGYDLDYSLQVGARYKIVVSYQILLEHLSEGNLNKSWLESSIILHRKWYGQLPRQSVVADRKIIKESDYLACLCVLGVALSDKGNKKIVIEYFVRITLRYFCLNKLRYGKKVFKYLMS